MMHDSLIPTYAPLSNRSNVALRSAARKPAAQGSGRFILYPPLTRLSARKVARTQSRRGGATLGRPLPGTGASSIKHDRHP